MTRHISCSLLIVLFVAIFVADIPSLLAQGPMPQASPEHQGLESEVGTWDATAKMWFAPDTQPMGSTAVEVNTMVGSLWLVSKYESNIKGTKFIGRGQFGYDPQKKKYVGTWIDSFSPHLSVMEGTMDEATKTLTMMSKSIDPMTGEESISKMVSTMIDNDHKKFEIFAPVEGKEDEWWKKMEINYTRR